MIRDDLRQAAGAAAVACAAAAAVEYVATVIAAPPGIGLSPLTVVLLLVLDVGLFALLWCVLAPVLGVAQAIARKLRGRDWAGWFGPPQPAAAEPGRAAIRLWGGSVAVVLFVAVASVVNVWFVARFKAGEVSAIVLAVVQLAVALVAAGAGVLVALALSPLARRWHPRLGRLNPLGSGPMAAGVLITIGLVGMRVAAEAIPELAPLVPWRHLLAVATLIAGLWGHGILIARFGWILPVAAERRRKVALGIAGGAAVMVIATLAFVGGHPETKTVAVSSSPPLATLVAAIRRANDFDRDGYGWLLGENDCAPFDDRIHPLARDVPDNGIDENCNGRDFSIGDLPSYRSGERMPVPDAYKGDWNILLLTIDAVRYDHTGFGGYKRDTTPNLDKLAARSASFSFCQAPSAGTMASVPAILTSRFFHSGVALDENVKPRKPPKLKPQNVLISEVVKRRGYTTGAILSHYYFNDWGMEQGFDTYDNSVGEKDNPRIIAADRLTDRALAWIGEHSRKRWFLWVHYIDPHGRYVAHPGEPSYGTSEMDLYDGEIRFTDKHVGRLLDEMARIPGGDRTIVIVTSDHGDAFNEHGFINHGQALYREILHVPLLVFVPNVEPRVIDGAVSPLDVLPTVADLAGVDISDLHIEGESLVPQLFYRRQSLDRVVFAETNYRKTLRAAVTRRYKLVYNIEGNFHELYDLRADPWEKKNVRSNNQPAFDLMKGHLDDWLERVYYARDRGSNQVMYKLRDVILSERPRPRHPIEGVSFDAGKIEILGWEAAAESYSPGAKVELSVYLAATDVPSADFRLQAEAWWEGGQGKPSTARSKSRFTGDGLFPTTRWRRGELIREKFQITLPSSWQVTRPARLGLGLKLSATGSTRVAPSRNARPEDPTVAVLGTIELAPLPQTGSPAPDQGRPPGSPP